MIQLQEAIKKIIERYVVGIVPITNSISVGDCIIPVQSSRRFKYGDEVIVYNKKSLAEAGEGEVHKVDCIIDSKTIVSWIKAKLNHEKVPFIPITPSQFPNPISNFGHIVILG